VKALVFLPQARADILDAFEWYEKRSQGLGLDFLRCLDAEFHAIERSPCIYPCVFEEYHRALLKRFPYAVFYEIKKIRLRSMRFSIVLATLKGGRGDALKRRKDLRF